MSKELKKLTNRHEAMLRLSVIEGATCMEICNEFGFTPGRFGVIQSDPLWISRAEELKEIALKEDCDRIGRLRSKAIGKMDECMDSDDEGIVLKSAKEILGINNMPAHFGKEEEKTVTNINLYTPANWNNDEYKELSE